MVIMAGVAGSGKTTLARAEYGLLERVSLDEIRTRGFGERKALIESWRPDSLPEPASRTRRAEHVLIARALASGRGVVIDDTNLTAAIRRHHILHGRAHGCRIHAVSFRNKERARRQNASRKGKARVPTSVFFKQAREFEPPRLDEGFDSVRTIMH